MSASDIEADDAGTEAEEKSQMTWEGELKDGWIPNGKGQATYPNGDTYQGLYENGQKNGQGKYVFANGAIYEGTYSNDQRNGHGVMHYPDNSQYKGSWFRGQRHGQGVYTYPNGDKYQGDWKNDLRHGRGSYYFAESMSSFVGRWEYGTFTIGEWVWRDGSTYEGTFIKTCRLAKDVTNSETPIMSTRAILRGLKFLEALMLMLLWT